MNRMQSVGLGIMLAVVLGGIISLSDGSQYEIIFMEVVFMAGYFIFYFGATEDKD